MAKKSAGIDRRTAIKGMGAAAITPLLPGCGPPQVADFDALAERVDTIVVLMMENRSFDQYFGALTLEEGRVDVDGLLPGMSNPTSAGGEIEVAPATVLCVDDPPHGWNSSRDQFNNGANDGFVRAYEERNPDVPAEVMGYFDRDTLTALYGLADDNALCDMWFCSQLSSTWPNRFYSHAAQNGGVHGNDLPEVEFPTIYDRLAEAGVSWGNYYSSLPFLLLAPGIGIADDELRIIERFYDDAAAGTLPSVTIIEPVYGRNDDHPPAHPVAGQVLIASVYEALRTSPQWDRTVFIITYDENGGFYDHVPPPLAADDRADEGFDQLGFRVPSLVIGPWVKAGTVSHVVYDHTSILALIEGLFGLEPLTARDAAADPLLDVFDAEALESNSPRECAVLDPIDASEEELYGPGCGIDVGFRSAGNPFPTGQPELEKWADEHIMGTHLDRRAQTDEIYEWLLARAEAQGMLRRV